MKRDRFPALRLPGGLALTLLLLTALALPAVPGPAGKQALHVAPRDPRQGEALLVRLEGGPAEGAAAAWRGKRYPLFRDDGGWSGSLPVSPDTPAGGHTLAVTFDTEDGPRRLERKVTVAAVRFPVQRLKMAARTAALYNYPGVEREERLIGGAIRTVTERALWRGDWLLPSRGRLSTPFGVRRLRNGKPVGRHRGLDIAAAAGTPVLAPAAGRVVLAGSYRKHGKTVVLDHGAGITSLYIHMSAISAKQGQTLLRGARLGRVGSTGVSTGPHLHWAVYVHGEPVDPQFFRSLARRGAAAFPPAAPDPPPPAASGG